MEKRKVLLLFLFYFEKLGRNDPCSLVQLSYFCLLEVSLRVFIVESYLFFLFDYLALLTAVILIK